jgi:hypothetical protein
MLCRVVGVLAVAGATVDGVRQAKDATVCEAAADEVWSADSGE